MNLLLRGSSFRVPEHLANLSNCEDESEGVGAVKSSIATSSSSLKRPAPSDFNDSGIEAKMEKLGEEAFYICLYLTSFFFKP